LLRDIIDLDTTYNRSIANVQKNRSQPCCGVVRRSKKVKLEAQEGDCRALAEERKLKLQSVNYAPGEKPIETTRDEE